MYVLRLADDGRILEVMDIMYKTDDTPVVNSYPSDNPYLYRYVDGQYVYDPVLYPDDEPADEPTNNEDTAAWSEIAAALREGVNSV